jgi:hypothetical protein
MASESLVAFVEEWQTGFFLVLAVTAVGVAAGVGGLRLAGPPGFFAGFLVGVLAAFLGYSYLRYGR